MPMKTGHRLAEAEPTVPTITVSAARAGVTARIAIASVIAAVRIMRMAPNLSINHFGELRKNQPINLEVGRDVSHLLHLLHDLADLLSENAPAPLQHAAFHTQALHPL